MVKYTLDPKTPVGVTKYFHYLDGKEKKEICFCRPAEVATEKKNYDVEYAETHDIPESATDLLRTLDGTNTIFKVTAEKAKDIKEDKKGKK